MYRKKPKETISKLKSAIYKTIIHHNNIGLILEMQGWFNIGKLISVIYHINKIKEKNNMKINRYKKIDKLSTDLWLRIKK